MKILLLALVSLTIVKTIWAQAVKEADIPSMVKTNFVSRHPAAKSVKWEKESNKYEAGFKQNKTEISVLFDTSGGYLQTETEIPVSSLPKAVLDYVSNNLRGKNIKEAAKIVDVAGNVTYEAEVAGTDYIFDSNGKFIKSETEDPDDDKDKK